MFDFSLIYFVTVFGNESLSLRVGCYRGSQHKALATASWLVGKYFRLNQLKHGLFK
jgi:hypothetical protein